MNITNNNEVDAFKLHRQNEPFDFADTFWASLNRRSVISAAASLHRTLCPNVERTIDEILATVPLWTFQRAPCLSNLEVIRDDSVLSMVPTKARKSFIEIRDAKGK